MNITFLAHKLNQRGGSSFSLDLMARLLSDSGHYVKILTTNLFQENNLPNKRPYEVKGDVVTSSTPLGALPEIKNILTHHEENTDIYHIFNPQYLPIAGWYRKDNEVPTVGRLNSYGSFCTNPAMIDGDCYKNCSFINKIIHDDRGTAEKPTHLPEYFYKHFSLREVNHLDRVFALSPSIKEIYSYNGIRSDLIDIVPNFYNPDFSCNEHKHVNILEDEYTLLYVGRLREEKGVDILIDAVGLIDRQNIAVNIVGDGPQLEQLVQRAERNGISDSVRVHGKVNHSRLPFFYTQSDLFVHPGRWPEPFGRTILEALQCECPLIVSDIGAPPWIIGEAGITFERGNAVDLADKMVTCTSEAEITRLKQNCHSRLDDFSPNSIITGIENTYQELFEP